MNNDYYILIAIQRNLREALNLAEQLSYNRLPLAYPHSNEDVKEQIEKVKHYLHNSIGITNDITNEIKVNKNE